MNNNRSSPTNKPTIDPPLGRNVKATQYMLLEPIFEHQIGANVKNVKYRLMIHLEYLQHQPQILALVFEPNDNLLHIHYTSEKTGFY
jgi:hypothetical protein